METSELLALAERLRELYLAHAYGFVDIHWLPPLIGRIVVGVMFAVSGYCKLFDPVRARIMRETVIKARIPLATLNAWMVSLFEFVFGIGLVLGAFTLLSALMLTGVTLVALLTLGYKNIEKGSRLFWISGLFYLPETLILAFLGLLIWTGPGALSVDAYLFGG